jgi:sodium-independent sulfate anion transporter 11
LFCEEKFRMGKFVAKWAGIKQVINNDVNLIRAGRGIRRGAKAFPSAAGRYVVGRMPIIRWLPNYSPSWIINDIVAGVTMGMLLIPQAIAFAVIAGIPIQDGLLASWLPPVLYSIMGTSKGMPYCDDMRNKANKRRY